MKIFTDLTHRNTITYKIYVTFQKQFKKSRDHLDFIEIPKCYSVIHRTQIFESYILP